MKDRIRLLMESQHMNQQSFASYLGLAPATLSSILQERTRPTLQTVDCISKKFPNINLGWLLYGSGEMFGSPAGGQSNVEEPDVAKATAGAPTAQAAQPTFDFGYDEPTVSSGPTRQAATTRQSSPVRSSMSSPITDMKIIDKPNRRITEIRVFYDDQTWESFVPKK